MVSHYAQSLELLTRVQEQINDIMTDAMTNCVTIQSWYALGRKWNSLKMALVATGQETDETVTASKQQRARYRTYANTAMHWGELRTTQANSCLAHFRYVTVLAHKARILKRHHESELLSWETLREHYEGDLGPHAHVVRPHQTFLDKLSCNIEAGKRKQGLKMVYIRWVQLRAAADLTQQAKNFHLTRKQLKVRKRRADEARRQAYQLQEEATQRVKEYEHLEKEVQKVQSAIQALDIKR